MKALTWQGRQDVRVEEVADPVIQEPTDAIIKVTSTAICGSDLHLYSVLGPFLAQGDVLGHETMGVVEEVGAEVTHLRAGDRVVIPFNISCGHCWMCERGLQSQCETTQVRSQGSGAALFGFSELYGSVPGGQAEYLRIPQAQYGPIKVPDGVPDERVLYLSDILPTAWQGVAYAGLSEDGARYLSPSSGLGPVGQLATRIARRRGTSRDRRRPRARNDWRWRGRTTSRCSISVSVDDVAAALVDLTGGRGPDAVLEAVGMEAHGSPAFRRSRSRRPDFSRARSRLP